MSMNPTYLTAPAPSGLSWWPWARRKDPTKLEGEQYDADVAEFFEHYGRTTKRTICYQDYLLNVRDTPPSAQEIAVDFGCGTGWLTSTLCEMGFQKVYGIDTSKEMLRMAMRLTAKELSQNGQIIYSESVPKDVLGHCDLVTAVHVHYHFETKEQLKSDFFGSIANMLKKEGEAVLIVPPEGYVHTKLLNVENFINRVALPKKTELMDSISITGDDYISLTDLVDFTPKDGSKIRAVFDAFDNNGRKISIKLTDTYWGTYALQSAAQEAGLFLQGSPIPLRLKHKPDTIASVAMHFKKTETSPT